jgi:hypothetical protein
MWRKKKNQKKSAIPGYGYEWWADDHADFVLFSLVELQREKAANEKELVGVKGFALSLRCQFA